MGRWIVGWKASEGKGRGGRGEGRRGERRGEEGGEERGGGGKGWWRDGLSHAKPPEAAHHIIGTGKKSALY